MAQNQKQPKRPRGRPPSPVPMKTTSVRLPIAAWEALGELAELESERHGYTVTSTTLVNEAVRTLLKSNGYDVYPRKPRDRPRLVSTA